MRRQSLFRIMTVPALVILLILTGCNPTQDPAVNSTDPPPKPSPVAPDHNDEPGPTPFPTPVILEDIGYPNAPYPTSKFGELLWQDNFNAPDPNWQLQLQPLYEQSGDTSYAAFETFGEEHTTVGLELNHPRNVIYQIGFQLPSGFTDFHFAHNPANGTQAYVTCFGKENQMTFRVSLRTGHDDPGQQLIEFNTLSENGWFDFEIRQYDRYVDFFVNGDHGFAFKMPDEMILDYGNFSFEVYNPFGENASLLLDSFTIHESQQENVFLDTLPLSPFVNRSGQVQFSDLPFETITMELPERYQTAEGWQASFLIAPGDVRNPNDLEFTSDNRLVVLQQRNWGMIELSPDAQPSWYLNTRDNLNTLVTNALLDRDRDGNLYLINDGQVFFVDQPGQAVALFPLAGHFSNLTQSPVDGMLYFIEEGKIKRWNGSNIEVVQEDFTGSGQLVFTDNGNLYFYGWGSRQVIELLPDTFNFKHAVFNGAFALPDIQPTAFNRINTIGNNLVLTYGSEVLQVDPQTGTVEVLASGFNQLEGISTASDGRICFTSRFDSGVYCWEDGLVTIAAMPNFQMTPMGMAVNSQGEIFSGNDEATHLFRYDPQGHYITAYEVNVCQAPQVDMTFDNADNLYVSAGEFFTSVSSLTRVDPLGQVEVLVDSAGIHYPSGIDWYDGHVYVVEAETGNLYRLEDDTSLALILTVPTPGENATIPMRMDRDGNFYIFITADKQMTLYQVTQDNVWTPINLGVDQRNLSVLEYWPEKHALLIGFTDFWDANASVLLYDIASGEAMTLFSGTYAVSGLALTPEGDILINDDWDNAMIRLTRKE
ncbi:MAG: hypothetical protein JXA25_18760 [Anaerolineales bacterium]|nr:hypothetical protein [Anaerolineales bacterium]